MKKFFLFTITLILMTGISMAAKNEAATTTNASSTKNTTAPATASSISMADLLKENQNLKLALVKTTIDNETLNNQLGYAHNMHAATNALYEEQMKKQQEDAKEQSTFAWMMHNVIVTLKSMVKGE